MVVIESTSIEIACVSFNLAHDHFVLSRLQVRDVDMGLELQLAQLFNQQ